MEGPQEGELPLQPLTHTLDAAATPAVPDPALADPLPPEPNPAPAPPAAPDASHGATSAPQTIPFMGHGKAWHTGRYNRFLGKVCFLYEETHKAMVSVEESSVVCCVCK